MAVRCPPFAVAFFRVAARLAALVAACALTLPTFAVGRIFAEAEAVVLLDEVLLGAALGRFRGDVVAAAG